MAGGRGVEDDVVPTIALLGQQGGKFVERGNLGGAGAGQLLTHGGTFVLAGIGFQLGEHAQAVSLGGRVGVDIEHGKTRHAGHIHRLVA